MADGENKNVNSNKKNDNIPEWLAQFKRELAGSEQSSEPEVKKNEKASYENADFKDAESILHSANGLQGVAASDYHPFAYVDLAGYEKAVTKLKFLGFGDRTQSQNESIINALNRFHGMTSRPALKPLVMIGDTPEEIEPLLNATADELSCATVRLMIQDTPTGLPGIAAAANKTCINLSRGKTPLLWLAENDGLLIIENVEDWSIFFDEDPFDLGDSMQPIVPVKLTPAGKEFLGLIEKCVENPKVQIICTACDQEMIPEEILDLLGDFSEVNIELPTKSERIQLWNQLSNNHPSLRGLNNSELADFCEGLTRHEIEVIANEAIAEAYNSGLKRGYCDSVTRENLMEKIILRLDPKSEVFKRIEDALVSTFLNSFEI